MRGVSRHPRFDALSALAEARLAPAAQAEVETHVAACARCTATVAWLARTLSLMRTDQSEDAPPAVIARAIRLLRPAPQTAPGSLRRRIAAILSFDSRGMALAPGLRGAAAQPRQLLYGAGEYEVDLRITAVGSAWALAGQVLGPGAGGSVLLEGSAGSASAALSELREFSLSPAAAGSYALRLLLDNTEIEIEGLELGR